MKKTILILMCMILLVSTISASTFSFNKKSFDSSVGKYGKVEIKDWWGFGSEKEITLINNTDICIGTNCEADITIIMYEDGVLIEDISFKVLKGLGIRNYSIYANGREYNLGDKVKAGNYELKILGNLNKFSEVDWQIKTNGYVITEWAVWLASLNNGLVSYFGFDEGSGTNTADFLGNVSNGTLYNTPQWFARGDGYYLNYTAGSSQYVNMTNESLFDDIFLGNTSMSISFLVWPSPKAVNKGIMVKGTNANNMGEVSLTSANLIRLMFKNSTNTLRVESVQAIPSDNWTLVTITYNGSQDASGVSIYLNGSLVSDTDAENTYTLRTSENENLEIGYYYSSYMEGGLDEIAIWNKELTSEEVASIWNNGDIRTYTNIPTLTLNTPIDYYNSSSQEITFNCSFTGVLAISNITLIFDALNNFTQDIGGGTSGSLQTNLTISEGTHQWTCKITGTDNMNYFPSSNNTVNVDVLPPLINFTQLNNIDYFMSGDNLTINYTINETTPNLCLLEYAGVNNTISCTSTGILFNITNATNKNVTLWVNDSFGRSNSSTMSWDYKIFENSKTYNSTVYETENTGFIINVTSNSTLTAASLIYNGTSYSSTKSGTIFTSNIDIPTVNSASSKDFNWNFTYGSQIINSSTFNHTVDVINLTLCGSYPQNYSYINFTFLNETVALESVNASITSSTFTYWIGSGLVNKTLTFSNSTENINYPFCFYPQNKTVNALYDISFKNSESPQRSRSETVILTNTSTIKTLYLLPTTDGLYSPFTVEDSVGNVLSSVNALITRVISGSTVTITSDMTDSSGFLTFWLNPDFTYTATFSKTGYTTNTFSFTPTSDSRTVIMGGTTTTTSGSVANLNTTYEIKPKNSTLSNDTVYTFSFNVTSTQSISLISMNVTNSSEYQLLYTSNAGAGYISGTLNTSSNTTFVGHFIIQTANETFEFSKVWIIGNEYEGSYSLHKQLRLFVDYGFRDFWKYLIILIVIVGAMIYMSANEVVESSESKIFVAILIIWAFSVVHWLDNPAVVSTTDLAQFGKQYGIAILSSAFATLFIFRRVFTTRV